MSVLHRKLARDLLEHKWILLTVIVLIGIGTGHYVGLASSQRILETSQREYYARNHFADFWIDLKKAPLSALDSIAKLPGVSEVEGRVVYDVILDVPGEIQPLTGRLISVPKDYPARAINGIHIVRGSAFSDDRDQEVILADDFARAHRLRLGDRIDLILNRRQQSFVIVGTAISPEYVYMVRGEGDFIPDPQHFGVLYIKDDYAREILGFQGACNQIVGRVLNNFKGDVNPLLDRMTRELDPYGVLAATPRSRQASHRFLSDEIRGLATNAIVLPIIFLIVAVLVLNIAMMRFAAHQRTVIGTLKALGYSDRRVFAHFLAFGLVVGVLGGLTGLGIGLGLIGILLRMYKTFFQFPVLVVEVYPSVIFNGMVVSVFFSLLGTIRGVWTALRLHPAEAMRARPPEHGGQILLERFSALWTRFGFRTHMALRSLFRNHVRTITGIVSSCIATALILSTLMIYDSMWFVVHFQFDRIAHGDVTLSLRDETSMAALRETNRLPAVDYAEPVFSLACDMRRGPHQRRLAVTGLPAVHRLTTPVQMDLNPVQIPPVGLVLTRRLADIMHVQPGEWLDITPVRGQRLTSRVPVALVIDSFFGLDCYADLGYLSRLVGETQVVNALQLRVNFARIDNLFRVIKTLPNVRAVSLRSQAKANIESTFIRSLTVTLSLTILFAGIIAFGTTLNNSLIEVFDRRTQIATFRVLGYRPIQIAGIFYRENAVVFLTGLVLAVPVAWIMAVLIARRYATEVFRMPVIVNPGTIIAGLLISLVFLLAVQIILYRQILKMELLEELKVTE